jgi:hypothetical protein
VIATKQEKGVGIIRVIINNEFDERLINTHRA